MNTKQFDFKPITIEDKEVFQAHFKNHIFNTFTFNFTSFFIWRNWDPFLWTEVNGAICVKTTFQGDAILCPFADNDQAILDATETMINWYAERGVPFLMVDVPQTMLEFFERNMPQRFQVCYKPEYAEYVYDVSDLANLEGKKYTKKRNHIHQFIRNNPDYQFVPMTKDLIPACRRQLELWYSLNKKSRTLTIEKEAIESAWQYMDRLDYTGACLMLGDRVIGFTIGEPLNDEMVGIHIEKADPEINGAYTLLNQLFVKTYWQDYKYINRAEDMGLPGLRKAKLSYYPCRMEKRYQLRVEQSETRG